MQIGATLNSNSGYNALVGKVIEMPFNNKRHIFCKLNILTEQEQASPMAPGCSVTKWWSVESSRVKKCTPSKKITFSNLLVVTFNIIQNHDPGIRFTPLIFHTTIIFKRAKCKCRISFKKLHNFYGYFKWAVFYTYIFPKRGNICKIG